MTTFMGQYFSLVTLNFENHQKPKINIEKLAIKKWLDTIYNLNRPMDTSAAILSYYILFY